MLSTQLTISNYAVILALRRSTTDSLETNPLLLDYTHIFDNQLLSTRGYLLCMNNQKSAIHCSKNVTDCSRTRITFRHWNNEF